MKYYSIKTYDWRYSEVKAFLDENYFPNCKHSLIPDYVAMLLRLKFSNVEIEPVYEV